MSEMVERVARALDEHLAAFVRQGATTEELAITAIAAMREPTQDMIDAGEGADDHSTRYAEAADCLTHWNAMIDAALKAGG